MPLCISRPGPSHAACALRRQRRHLSCGRKMPRMKTQAQNSAIWMIEGPIAPRYMSPTDLPSWSASTTRTSDGGTSCVMGAGGCDDTRGVAHRVAVLQHHGQRDEAHRDNRGSHRTGDGTKNRAHTMTAYERPPRRPPNSCPKPSSRSSASPHRSRMAPISVKNGIASSRSFEITENSWKVRLPMKFGTNRPSSMPMIAKIRPTAPMEKAAGSR